MIRIKQKRPVFIRSTKTNRETDDEIIFDYTVIRDIFPVKLVDIYDVVSDGSALVPSV